MPNPCKKRHVLTIWRPKSGVVAFSMRIVPFRAIRRRCAITSIASLCAPESERLRLPLLLYFLALKVAVRAGVQGQSGEDQRGDGGI